MGLKKVFGQFLGTKHIVTSFKKFRFNFGLKMKDLAGLLSEEKKYVTGVFFWVLRIFRVKNVKKSPRTPRRTGQVPSDLAIQSPHTAIDKNYFNAVFVTI